jgi:hypothetical protein
MLFICHLLSYLFRLFVSLSKRKKKGSIRKVSIGFILKCSHLLLYRARNYAIAPWLFSRLCRYFTSLSFLLFLCLHFFFILICFMFFCFSLHLKCLWHKILTNACSSCLVGLLVQIDFLGKIWAFLWKKEREFYWQQSTL